MTLKEKDSIICSFCNKNHKTVSTMISGPSVYICSECVDLCSQMIQKFEIDKNEEKKNEHFLYPYQIKELLDKEIIGQENAKKIISVAAFMHNRRVKSNLGSKSNILIIGPTGSGKTLMIKTLAQILDVPIAMADATTLTEAGYVGDDVESIISKLLQAANNKVELAQKGIIYIDEIDKIAKTFENKSISRDVSGEGVQQGLLKLIEGSVISVPHKSGSKHPNQEMIQVDTKDILFICGGAFEGLDKIIQSKKFASSVGIGSKLKENSPTENMLDDLDSSDLVKFGLIPEFVGRLPVRVVFDMLTVEDLMKIIIEPKSSILNQYKSLLETMNVDLEATKDALKSIAKTAFDKKTGARGIKNVLEDILVHGIFDIKADKSAKLIIDEEVATGKKKLKLKQS